MKRIMFLIIIMGLFVLGGCGQPSETVLRYQDNHEIIGKEKEEILGEISDTIYESIDRSNTEAKETMIGPIARTGEEVVLPEGRYIISGNPPVDPESKPVPMEPQSGNVYVYDEDGAVVVHEIIDQSFGVNSVTVGLNGTQKVHLDGLNHVFITPVATELSNELSTGIWEVGKDIKEGQYVVTTPQLTLGYLQLFEKDKSPRVFEIIGSSTDSKINVQLKNGQKLRITGLSLLQFKLQ